MDTKKQRQCRRDDARLTESGNASSEQLNTRGAYRVTNQQSLACLSGSERQRPGWFLDMKYQTCFLVSEFDVTPSLVGGAARYLKSSGFQILFAMVLHCSLHPRMSFDCLQ